MVGIPGLAGLNVKKTLLTFSTVSPDPLYKILQQRVFLECFVLFKFFYVWHCMIYFSPIPQQHFPIRLLLVFVMLRGSKKWLAFWCPKVNRLWERMFKQTKQTNFFEFFNILSLSLRWSSFHIFSQGFSYREGCVLEAVRVVLVCNSDQSRN